MSSDYIRALNAVDVWAILDEMCSRQDMRLGEEPTSVVVELITYGYRQAVDDFGKALHELSEFMVLKENLGE